MWNLLSGEAWNKNENGLDALPGKVPAVVPGQFPRRTPRKTPGKSPGKARWLDKEA
jgi:hypothetical protein